MVEPTLHQRSRAPSAQLADSSAGDSCHQVKQQVVERSNCGGMSSAVPCRTGGAANDRTAPAIASVRLPSEEQVEILTKALLTVAGHLKSPKKISSGFFNAGLGIVLIALADSPRSLKYQQLQCSSGVDRGRAAVGTVAKWALEMCRRPRNRELTVELLRKAESASSATKATLLKRFALIRNPVSVCRELGVVVTALVRALADAEVVGGSCNETSSTAATDGIVPPAGELVSLPSSETLMARREQPLPTQSTVGRNQVQQVRVFGAAATASNSAVVECAGAGAGEGVTASGKIGVTAIQGAGDVAVVGGVDSVDKTVDVLRSDPDGDGSAAPDGPSAAETTNDKTATPGSKEAADDVSTDLGSSPHCGTGRRCSLELAREEGCPGGNDNKAEGVDKKPVGAESKPSLYVARPHVENQLDRPPGEISARATEGITGRRQPKLLGGPNVVAGAAVLEKRDPRRNNSRATHVSEKHARPPVPASRVGCE
ncbi:unnamed protein product, partial [Laminaria digitata]